MVSRRLYISTRERKYPANHRLHIQNFLQMAPAQILPTTVTLLIHF